MKKIEQNFHVRCATKNFYSKAISKFTSSKFRSGCLMIETLSYIFQIFFKTIRNKHLHQTFKCVICDKELSTHQKLKQHIQKKHENKNDSFVISINQLNDAFNQDESDYEQNI
jgi:hypothetical protein